MRLLAISDIHGCLATFRQLLKTINFSKKDQLYLVGDFIDRGEDSKGVIDHIWALQKMGFTIRCLKGNHESILVNGRKKGEDDPIWLHHGGKATLKSFQATSSQEIPNTYVRWMDELPHYLEEGLYIFTHAGLSFETPNPLDNQYDMLWIRNWYDDINYNWLGNRTIVHGHTPIKKRELKKQFLDMPQTQYLDIDAGCVFSFRGLGHLCAVDLTNRQLYFQARNLAV
ncbi:MAG: metallophosphoesterase family protein [Bacteroidota bacterium]